MAKIGEGDPRWIVQDRQDGQNVNAWHWEEKDVTKVTHDNIKAALKNLVVCDGAEGMTIKVKEVSDISGDVCVSQRKGRIMSYFDVKLTAKYEGTLDGCADKVEGKFTIPEVDHESFKESFEINVAGVDSKAHNEKGERYLRANARAAIREAIAGVFHRLFAEYRVGTNVKTGQAVGGSPKPQSSPSTTTPSTPPVAAAPSRPVGAVTTIDWKLEWRVPVEELWTVLTDERRATAYTRGPAKINPQPTGTFSYLDGVISGYFVEISHPTKITMQWRLNSWPAGVFSSVIIQLSREEANVTRMEFAQAGIPEGEVDRVRQGWSVNFWDAIKAIFGYQFNYL